ncbi:MAG TPA: hypothetical protein VK589_25295 [Chryseolinea sp.]|nr:hypothetical protein [Chryseolinea sp.]
MELRDVIVTPVVLILVYIGGYFIRARLTDEVNRIYFFPALTVKVIGALALGFIYQFYYGGGDTFTYHTHGSRHIWEALMDEPTKGIKLLLGNGTNEASIYKYSSKILFITDPSSFTIVRIAGFVDLFTFSSYSATAVLFAFFSFFGMWMFFLAFYEQYPHLHRWLAFASFFIPSVFFWGSGLLKDTITLGCLGFATYALYKTFIVHTPTVRRSFVLLGSLYLLWSIKVYILLTFLPAAIIWIFLANLKYARGLVLKILLFPFVLGISGVLGYYAAVRAGEDSAKYSLENIGRTARITAYDIRFQTGKDAGSGYTLGELDGTIGSMIALAPQAINATLFRPYLWEVNNPLMFLSAIESLVLLCFCLYVLLQSNVRIWRCLAQPDILFALLFSIPFAFAVGVSTFNFGTLVRYKIPMLPFLTVALGLILHYSNSLRNKEVFDSTE